MFDSIAAIDIGSSSVKMVLAKKGLKAFQITDVVSEPVDLSAPSHAESLGKAIQRLTEKLPIGNRSVVVTLPMEKTIIRTISFPFNDPDKIGSAVNFEAQENIPFEIQDLDLDYQITSSIDDEKGNVIVAAAHRDTVHEYMKILESHGLHPVFMGMEANALFECYSNFSYSGNETVVLADIGYTKTIVNVAKNNKLVYTRSISIGTETIIRQIADISGLSIEESRNLFEKMHLDINDPESALKVAAGKNSALSKQKARAVFECFHTAFTELCGQIRLTLKSFSTESGITEYNRFLYSGGASHIAGLYTFFHKELGIRSERAEFSLSIGIALSYFTSRGSSINFLKGEFRPAYVSSGRKQYRIALIFGSAALLILAVNLSLGAVFKVMENKNYNVILESEFKRNFQNRAPQGDPVADAEKMVAQEKKDLASLYSVVPPDDQLISVLFDVTSSFPGDPTLQLKNLVIDREFVRFDGDSSSAGKIDEFKNKLVDSKKFESVNLNTTAARKDLVSFSVVIKLKKSTVKPAQETAGPQ